MERLDFITGGGEGKNAGEARILSTGKSTGVSSSERFSELNMMTHETIRQARKFVGWIGRVIPHTTRIGGLNDRKEY